MLTSPNQEAKVLATKVRTTGDRTYYQFEFATKANNYIRRALAIVTVANGRFYTLTTGANEKRWGKMKPRLELVCDSFEVNNVY